MQISLGRYITTDVRDVTTGSLDPSETSRNSQEKRKGVVYERRSVIERLLKILKNFSTRKIHSTSEEKRRKRTIVSPSVCKG